MVSVRLAFCIFRGLHSVKSFRVQQLDQRCASMETTLSAILERVNADYPDAVGEQRDRLSTARSVASMTLDQKLSNDI